MLFSQTAVRPVSFNGMNRLVFIIFLSKVLAYPTYDLRQEIKYAVLRLFMTAKFVPLYVIWASKTYLSVTIYKNYILNIFININWPGFNE
jgi:hypothetical protein